MAELKSTVSSFSYEFVDPYDTDDPYLWTKVEHLGRYLWVRDVLSETASGALRSTAHLDVGCGTGYGLELLENVVGTATGIDYDPEALRRADATAADCRLVRADLDTERLEDVLGASAGVPFDSVTAFEVLEHVDDGERLIAGIAAVCRAGASLFLSVPNSRYEHCAPDGSPKNVFHERIYELDEVLQLLDAAGFSVRQVLGQTRVNELLQHEKRIKQLDRSAPRPSLNPMLHERDALITLGVALGIPDGIDIELSYAYSIEAVRR